MMDAIRTLDRIADAVRQRDSTQFLNYAHRLLNVLRRFVHSVFARVAVHLGTVQGVAANVALIVVAVDFGAAAGQASGPVVRAIRQYHCTSVLFLWQRRRRPVKVAASAAVQSIAGRALAARHHHAAQWALIRVIVETGIRTAAEGGRVQGFRGTAVHHVVPVVVLATFIAVVAVVVIVVALPIGSSRRIAAKDTDSHTALTDTGTRAVSLVHQICRTHHHRTVAASVRVLARGCIVPDLAIPVVLVQSQPYRRYHPTVLVAIRIDLDLHYVRSLLVLMLRLLPPLLPRRFDDVAPFLAATVRRLHFRDSSPAGCHGIGGRSANSDKYRCSGPGGERQRDGRGNGPD